MIFGSIRVSKEEFTSSNCTLPGNTKGRVREMECVSRSGTSAPSAFYLVPNVDNATAEIQQAVDRKWFNDRTKSVVVSLNTYNPSMSLFGAIYVRLDRFDEWEILSQRTCGIIQGNCILWGCIYLSKHALCALEDVPGRLLYVNSIYDWLRNDGGTTR